MKVRILMSTYNGEKYLQEQLDSLYEQTVPVEIYVRDDGSTDATKHILETNCASGKLTWYSGKNLGVEKSFWDLLQSAPAADYYAFCDQDDVWFSNKIERAINKIREEKNQNLPILYCCTKIETDETLKPLECKFLSSVGETDFAHSLLFCLASGCTFVFNDAALQVLRKYDMEEQTVAIHDWLAHKIIAMFGTIIYDKEPMMFYRQHTGNVIGSKKSGLKMFINRAKSLLGENASIRSNVAKSLLSVYETDIEEEKLNQLRMVANYKEDKKIKKLFLKTKAFSTNKKNDFFLHLLIRLNKI